MKKRYKISIWLVLVVVGFTITGAYFFGKALVETKLRDELALRGFSDIIFNVSSIGLKGISFSDISLGDKLPFKLGSITLDYSIVELLRGNLRDLHLDSIHITKDDMRVEIKNVQAHFEGARHGSWSVESIDIHNAPVPIPPLAGAGTFDMQKDPLRAKGAFQSANNSHRANFSLQYDSDHPDTSKLTIETAAFPWNGGVVSTQNAVIPLGANKAAELTLKLTNIPLDILLKGATGSRATATGVVSGTLPVVITKKGEIIFKNGKLKANKAGTIILAPDAIPGDNEQVAILRTVLGNFHYQTLSLGIDSDKDDKLSMLLQLSGNNPDAYNGRQVNLNVNLSGDVLSLLQQSVISVTDPKKFLEQNK